MSEAYGGSEEGGTARWQQPQDGPPDHRVPFDGTEDAAVAGVLAVVAHDPQRVARHDLGAEVGRDHLRVEVRLDEDVPVHVDDAVAPLDGLTGEGDDPLDVV